jgi:hypothetical protein
MNITNVEYSGVSESVGRGLTSHTHVENGKDSIDDVQSQGTFVNCHHVEREKKLRESSRVKFAIG